MKTPLISVSGVRGIVGETFTEDLVQRFCAAFAHRIIASANGSSPRVVLGRDTRQSGEDAIRVAAHTFASYGVEPIVVGIAPTPTVARSVPHHAAHGGLIITGSHNPVEWNALKFVGPDGIFLAAEHMETLAHNATAVQPSPETQSTPEPVSDPDAIQRHVSAICSLPIIDSPAIATRAFRVVVDPVNGAGARAIPVLLKSLGVQATYINDEPSGLFAHNPEPRADHLKDLADAVRKTASDIGFATDPDADRLALIDENGTPISEEYTVTLAALSVLSSQEETQSSAPVVVVNMSTTRMVDDVAAMFGGTVIRTAVGERHVVEGMQKHSAAIGGEGNGGVIYTPSQPGRDSLIGITLLLQLMTRTGKTLSELINSIPRYKMKKEKIPSPEQFNAATFQETILQAFPAATISTLDGVRADTPDGWVHVRPSNTEPVIRIIGEARTQEQLDRLFSAVTP